MKIVVRRKRTEPPASLMGVAREEVATEHGITARELARKTKQEGALCMRALQLLGKDVPLRTEYEPFKGGPGDPVQVLRYFQKAPDA